MIIPGDNNICKQVELEWPGTCYITKSDSWHSKGVAILISPKVKYKYVKSVEFDCGCMLICIINYSYVTLTLACVYAPNLCKVRITFIEKLQRLVKQFSIDYNYIILAGDFNTTDQVIDRSSKTIETCSKYFSGMKDYLNVIDCWHYFYKNDIAYTYCEFERCFGLSPRPRPRVLSLARDGVSSPPRRRRRETCAPILLTDIHVVANAKM